jgi:hypothetical protein
VNFPPGFVFVLHLGSEDGDVFLRNVAIRQHGFATPKTVLFIILDVASYWYSLIKIKITNSLTCSAVQQFSIAADS